jgi:dihydropteroate synthase
MRLVGPPSPWRYPVLVSGESDRPTLAEADESLTGSRFLRARLLNAPVTALAPLIQAAQRIDLDAELGPARTSDFRSGKIADGILAGTAGQIRAAADQIESIDASLSASLRHAIHGFEAGPPAVWQCGRFALPTGSRPLVMGVINITPDSFSDGGLLYETDAAVTAALQMVSEGADIIDLGGESTRPGARCVPAEEELARVCPVIERLGSLETPISIDTSKAAVARAALERGASIINDVTALTGDPGMLPLAASSDCGLALMHMKGTPRTMQEQAIYADLIREVFLWLHSRTRACLDARVGAERIAVDPGLGFSKTFDHNLAILRRLRELTSLGLPVLVGPSRKSFLGRILGLSVEDRLEGTLAASSAAVLNGASVIRVHDVRETVRAVQVAAAIGLARSSEGGGMA